MAEYLENFFENPCAQLKSTELGDIAEVNVAYKGEHRKIYIPGERLIRAGSVNATLHAALSELDRSFNILRKAPSVLKDLEYMDSNGCFLKPTMKQILGYHLDPRTIKNARFRGAFKGRIIDHPLTPIAHQLAYRERFNHSNSQSEELLLY